MKLSTKGRYGLRALIDLAVHSVTNQPITLTSIAERQEISEIYLEQVFSALRKTGIVSSVKGSQGGYLLNEKPRKITVGSVLRSLEGELNIVDANVNALAENNLVIRSVKELVWDKIDERIAQYVDSTTLEELMEIYSRVHGYEIEFYI